MAKKKRNTIRSAKQLDEKYLGREPILANEPDQSALISAFNWYRYFCDAEKGKQFLIELLKQEKRKDEMKLVKKASKTDITSTGISLAWLARIKFQGTVLCPRTQDTFDSGLKNLLVRVQKNTKPVVEDKEPKKVVSVQTRMKLKSYEIVADLEDALDAGEKFSCYEYLQSNKVSSPLAMLVLDKFEAYAQEVELAYTKKDEQCVEAYKNYKKGELNKMFKTLSEYVSDLERYALNAKKLRKPRKKKETPITKMIEKLKYQETEKNLQLVSIEPTKIIGIDRLIVFNTKYKTITFYNADTPKGLSVKGTTLQGFSKSSQTRKLRKPKEVLDVILKSTKAKSVRVMNSLTTKPSTPTGRLNDNTILLKVFK